MKKPNWKRTRVGKLAEPKATELYHLVRDWVIGYCDNGAVHPADIAIVAQAVVEKVAEDEGLYIAANQRDAVKPAKKKPKTPKKDTWLEAFADGRFKKVLQER